MYPNANWMKGQVFGLAEVMKEDLEKPWNALSSEYRNILLHGSDQIEVTFSYNNKKNGRKGEITRHVEGIYHWIIELGPGAGGNGGMVLRQFQARFDIS